jgi:hypothetical protein
MLQDSRFAGRTRFDFSYLNSVDLANVELVMVGCIEDFMAVPFLFGGRARPLVVCSRPVCQAGLLKV